MQTTTALSLFLTLLYATASIMYWSLFVTPTPVRSRVARILLVIALLIHLVTLFIMAATNIQNASQTIFLSGLGFCLAVAWFLIDWVSCQHPLGIFVVPIVFLIQCGAIFATPEPSGTLPGTPLLWIHVGLAMTGYSALTISAIFAAIYLLMYHQIKAHRMGILFDRLPALNQLERISYRSIHFGLGLLIAAVAVGQVLFFQLYGHLIWLDSKILVALLAIVLYGATIILRTPWAIQGKRLALASITGFAVVLFSLLLVDHLFPGFHVF